MIMTPINLEYERVRPNCPRGYGMLLKFEAAFRKNRKQRELLPFLPFSTLHGWTFSVGCSVKPRYFSLSEMQSYTRVL